MAGPWRKTQYSGVRYREHSVRQHLGNPDRYFAIRYRISGQLKEKGFGWASAGRTAERASAYLAGLKAAEAAVQGPVPFEEQRERAAAVREAKQGADPRSQDDAVTFGELAERYLNWARSGKKSWRDDEQRLKLHILPLLAAELPGNIQSAHLEHLKRKCEERGLAPATVAHCLTLVGACFNFAARSGLSTGINPVKGVPFPAVDNKRIRFLSRQEAGVLLDAAAARDRDLHGICLICLYTGMRVGEIATLRWSHIDFEDGSMTIHGATKGVTRRAFLTPPVKRMLLRRYLNASGAVVYPDMTGSPRTRVSRSFRLLVDSVGFNKNLADPRQKITFHTLRHTFASWLALQGENLLTIKELMGHKAIAMTLRYAYLMPDQKRKAVERLAQ